MARYIPVDPRETQVLMDTDTTVAVPTTVPVPMGQKIRFLDNNGTANSHNITVTGVLGGTITLNTAYGHTMVEFVGNGWAPA